MAKSRGIVYLFCGIGFAERMIVSIWSLRRHYDGSVTVMVTDDDCEQVMRAAETELSITIQRVEKSAYRRNAAYATKTQIPRWTPYDRTLFIDGDTLVVGDPTPLLNEKLDDTELLITNFAEWQSQGSKMRKRISGWRGLTPAIDALVDSQLGARWPALNTGVFAFHKGWQYARLWETITTAGSPRHMADELAMQLLTSAMEPNTYEVIDDRWNCSPIYGENRDNVVIWHFHGRKHLRKEDGAELWAPAFEECRDINVGGIADWAGKYDKTVKQYLEESKR